jgi:protein-S-isoprenylcysteine O-methyltransferase Ste14
LVEAGNDRQGQGIGSPLVQAAPAGAMVDVATVQRAFRRLGITGQAASGLMVLFGVLVLVYPNLTDMLLGAFFIVTGLVQLGGSIFATAAARKSN